MMRLTFRASDGSLLAEVSDAAGAPQIGEVVLIDHDPEETTFTRYRVTDVAWNVTPKRDASGHVLAYVIVWIEPADKKSS
jgi:hypothetical protein